MVVKWTDEQLNAINAANGTIVSAAAGSGKTAVLVERTIRLLCSEKNKIPADKFLAVTFTKDAANQLKDKLSNALDKKSEENPDSEWIRNQQDLLPLANINTINAFCLDIVKSNIHSFELQGDVRILDDADSAIILSDALDQAFEYFYSRKPEMMRTLMDRLTNGNESSLKSIISQLYRFLRSLPFPEEWCAKYIEKLKNNNAQNDYVSLLAESYEKQIDTALKKSEYAGYIIKRLPASEEKHWEIINDDNFVLKKLKQVMASKDWEKIYQALNSYKFSSKQFPKKAQLNQEDSILQNSLMDTLKSLRSDYKDMVKGLADEVKKTGRNIDADLKISAKIFEYLLEIFNKVQDITWEMKAEKNALTFSDVEIMTVKLLTKNNDGKIVRTPLAEEMVSNKDYMVILIDEFQDVNNLQDLIFKAISDTDDLNVMGKNVFVVGDVKQSIYRFRQSNPLIFIKTKEQGYDESLKNVESLMLSKNFRSRKNVLDFVNCVFTQLMSKQVGEIQYTEDEKLKLGAKYGGDDPDTEIMIIKGDDNVPTDKIPEYLNFDKEHYAIAQKIKAMIEQGYPVYEGENQRPCRMSDFCVLSRKTSDNRKMAKALEYVGLKAFAEESSGYLRSREIAVMINLLRVIDNPMNDIALASVLMSPIFGFSADDMAEIRIFTPKSKSFYTKRIYQIINAIAENSQELNCSDDNLKNKCQSAVSCIKKLRFYSSSMPLEALIRKIYDETDFFAVASAFENSTQKRANLRLLLELASSYEKNYDGSTAGFIRYIESVGENGNDFKQAVTVTAGENSVAVKTIHKSKGLEYPFVFLCGLSEKFNLSDNSKRLLLNERYGFALKLSNHHELSITEPVNYAAIKKIGHDESLSEELRLLYVAMTRAKEKLFIVLNLKHGHFDDYKKVTELNNEIALAGGINSNIVSGCSCFAQWIYAVLLCLKGNDKLLTELNLSERPAEIDPKTNITYTICESIDDITASSIYKRIDMPSEEKVQKLVDKYNYKYPYDEADKPAKMTVTEIVKEEKERLYGEKNPEFYPQLPRLEEEIGKLSNTEKGTYTHLFMELADYDNACKDVRAELDRLVNQGFFTKRQSDGVYINAVEKFFHGDFYDRISRSDQIIREKSFLVAFSDLNLSEKYSYLISEDGMLQGIADCLFKENDGYVLVDYKTDNFKDISELYGYQTQLELYKAALDLTMDMPIKSCYIYSFKLSQGVEISMTEK
ncbi:MAG: helicase-exonuclease AddAB subunit AddA [Oscillospiraceae bacterium]